jgi:hypothetical protein
MIPNIRRPFVRGVAPFGFGMNQATLASRVLTSQMQSPGGRSYGTRRRRRNGTKKKPAAVRRAPRRNGKRAHLVKGSAAARRHMARLRRMRRR